MKKFKTPKATHQFVGDRFMNPFRVVVISRGVSHSVCRAVRFWEDGEVTLSNSKLKPVN